MSFQLSYNRKNNIWFIIVLVTALVIWYTTGIAWWVLIPFMVLYYLMRCCRLEVTAGIPKAILLLAEMIGGSWLTVMMIQYLLLEQELFIKTKNFKLFLNVLVVLCFFLVFLVITKRPALTCTIVQPILLIFGFVDYFVYSFRGNELTFADLQSAGTGLSVAGNYKFVMEDRCGYVMLAAILFITLVWQIHLKVEHYWIMRVVSVLVAAGCVIFVALKTASTNTETWEKKGTYRNGYVLNFCLQIRDSFIFAPDGYSTDTIAELEKGYEESSSDYSAAEVTRPTIIAIMSESFADLSVLGDGDLETNIELTPFLDSLTENTLRGYALSSVYSAKTPNSEWEFMTGNSMAFMPQGSVVYQQFIDDDPTSIVSNLSNIGYTCVAIHPYYATGWSRNTIYPTMGFDEMYFIDDFDQEQLLRKYITDEAFYDKIIERYESSPSNEDLFIMGISMQNHGGYGEEYDNMEQYVFKYGLSYTDVNQYLQLVHETDMATEKLIEYFSNVDDPVEIIFFGDHQPGLNSKFYELMNGKGLSGLTLEELEELYTIPFFIWTNYDTEEEEIELTSINYLSTLALERANIDLPAYNQFLADMMEEIPAINSQAYYSIEAGTFKYLSDASGEEAEWINNYNILQYNNMFDEKNRSSLFFPYLNDVSEYEY